jgi:hypothetical protein
VHRAHEVEGERMKPGDQVGGGEKWGAGLEQIRSYRRSQVNVVTSGRVGSHGVREGGGGQLCNCEVLSPCD